MFVIQAWVLLISFLGFFSKSDGSSLLCGRTKAVELGGGGVASALALALVRPRSNDTAPDPEPCALKMQAADAAAFSVRLIDVKESLTEYGLLVGGGEARKWSARGGARAQDTSEPGSAHRPANDTEPCTLSIFVGEQRSPAWRLSLCGSNAAAVAARAGARLLPARLRVVWAPPASPYHHTEKLRLVVTAVNSGAVCNSSSQLPCGATGLCVSASLGCDGVRHCPGGEDEAAAACARRRDPPLLEFLRRLAARNQELLGLDPPDTATKPSVIMKIGETEQKSNALTELGAALKPYGPWGYLVVGMLICATVLMFCLAWECCCKKSKPSDIPLNMPASCVDLSPSVTIATTASSQILIPRDLPSTPPAYDPPPSYSSLFPRAFKSSPTPVPHCSHEEPPPD